MKYRFTVDTFAELTFEIYPKIHEMTVWLTKNNIDYEFSVLDYMVHFDLVHEKDAAFFKLTFF